MDEFEGNRESIYHRDTFIFAVNTAISSMNRRFTSRKAILTDFDLLNLECFQKTNEKQLCALKKVAKNYRLEDEKLRDEYSSFFNNYRKLRKAREESNPQPAAGESFDIKRDNFHSVLQLMIKYNPQSALPGLFLLYKILISLPIGSTNCERASSKLKIVSMGQDSLSNLMKINIESDRQ